MGLSPVSLQILNENCLDEVLDANLIILIQLSESLIRTLLLKKQVCKFFLIIVYNYKGLENQLRLLQN